VLTFRNAQWRRPFRDGYASAYAEPVRGRATVLETIILAVCLLTSPSICKEVELSVTPEQGAVLAAAALLRAARADRSAEMDRGASDLAHREMVVPSAWQSPLESLRRASAGRGRLDSWPTPARLASRAVSAWGSMQEIKSESGRQPTLALICSPQLLQRAARPPAPRGIAALLSF